MKPHLPLKALTALLGALAVTGCGVANPYQHSSSTAVKTAVDTTVKPTVSTATVLAGVDDRRTLLRRYTQLSINWTATTLQPHQRELARLATGGARAQALQTAATYGSGSTLQKSGVSNRGQITSIARGQGPRAGWWVITTQETTAGRGDYHGLPAQPHIYDAHLTHTSRGWTVSTWSPQN